MLGLVNRPSLNFDSLGMVLNRIEGLLRENPGSAIAVRMMVSATASHLVLFRLARGGIAQQRPLSPALTSPGPLLAIMSVALSGAYPETKDDFGFNTGNASAS